MEKLTINLHFIDSCNFCCKHCFVKKNGKELFISNIKLIADKLTYYSKKNNIKIRVNLAGGEPLLSRWIQHIIDYLYNKGLEVSLITNGYYLNYPFIFRNRFRLSMIGISVDSLSYATNMIIGRHCKGMTLTKDDLVRRCSYVKDCGIPLKINTCITSLNLNEDINALIDEVKPDRFKVLRAYCDDNHKEFRITDEEWNDSLKKYPYASVTEDNDYMANNYLIIDSEGNLSKNNLHVVDNSLLKYSFEECLENLKKLEGHC